ncbi:short chain dehydrogenase/reductase [Aspergillus insuetus]
MWASEGGASGIGLAIVRDFAEQPNTTVCIVDVNSEAGCSVTGQLSDEFRQTSFVFKKCNVASWEEQATVFKQLWNEQGNIDVVILIATSKTDPAQPNLDVIDVNVYGVIYSIRLAIHYMGRNALTETPSKTTSRGTIVCMASVSGLFPFSASPLYSPSKHCVVGLVRSLARGLSAEHFRIQINAIAPGSVATNFSLDQEGYSQVVVTPMDTVIKAVRMLVNDPTHTGQTVALHRQNIDIVDPPRYLYEETGSSMEFYWSLKCS